MRNRHKMNRVGIAYLVSAAMALAACGCRPQTTSTSREARQSLFEADAGVDAEPDGPDCGSVYEERVPGPFVSYRDGVHQIVPYTATAGNHVVTVRLTGNNGNEGDDPSSPGSPGWDGAELSFDLGVNWCGPARRPVRSPVGSVLECPRTLTSMGSADTLDVTIRMASNACGGWDIQHEYVTVDNGPRTEVPNPP